MRRRRLFTLTLALSLVLLAATIVLWSLAASGLSTVLLSSPYFETAGGTSTHVHPYTDWHSNHFAVEQYAGTYSPVGLTSSSTRLPGIGWSMTRNASGYTFYMAVHYALPTLVFATLPCVWLVRTVRRRRHAVDSFGFGVGPAQSIRPRPTSGPATEMPAA